MLHQPTQQYYTKEHDKQNTTNCTNDSRLCNCRNHNQCPMPGNCLQANVVNKAEITTTDNNETNTYIGVTAKDKIPEPHKIHQQHQIPKRDRTFQIDLATEEKQPTTQDQV